MKRLKNVNYVKILHSVMNPEDAKMHTSIEDIDGNVIRLIQLQ